MADPELTPSPWHRGADHARTQARLIGHLLRWIVLGAASGVLAGVASWAFLEALDHVIAFRLEHDWILFLLPVAGLGIGLVYHHLGGRAAQGNNLLIEEIHDPTDWIPRRMAPLVFVGTLVSQLFGASVGREGTAIQMSGSLSDLLARVLRLDRADRRILLIAALAGGFGSVFGVPLAGAVFGLEVQAVGQIRYDALVPALTASIVGDLVVKGLGYEHAAKPQLSPELTPSLALKVAVAGLAFGLASIAFVEVTHLVKRLAGRLGWPPVRPVVGGVATVALALLFGQQYLGLSLPLISTTLAGHHPSIAVPILKIVFTAVAIGCGFPGGEVTPLFVIGTTLGGALAPWLGVPVPVLAGIGFVAVFAGATNTPLACTIMAVEVFGGGLAIPAAIGCVVAYVFSSHRGIYDTQRIATAKGHLRLGDLSGRGGLPRMRDWRSRPPG